MLLKDNAHKMGFIEDLLCHFSPSVTRKEAVGVSYRVDHFISLNKETVLF